MAVPQFQLVSKEGQAFSISEQAAQLSSVLRSHMDASGPERSIPLPSISAEVLELVVEYLQHYEDPALSPPVIEKPIKTANFSVLVPAWDFMFSEKPHEVLFELIIAANSLNIPGLLELSGAKVASMIKGRTAEEIRSAFNVTYDFTPEEEAQIREENRWTE